MTDSTVSHHPEPQAASLPTEPQFKTWAQTMTEVIADHDFLTRRLRERTPLRTIAPGKP
ncbi:hypothetical protein OHB54_45775 [Streptomyces sp. NBC_01007]|nr:hypothetical protein OHB54_45775 [Streptomyces sp. NBC_01007]